MKDCTKKRLNTILTILVTLAANATASAQNGRILRSSAGHDAGLSSLSSHAARAQDETYSIVRAHFTDAAHAAHASVWLVVTAKYYGAPATEPASGEVTLRIPLSSTEDAYGESRSCTRRNGAPRMLFEAGLDEKNFIPFADSASDHDFRFLLNKYLCRALAAPFHCGDRDITLPRDMSLWRFAEATVSLHSDGPAAMQLTNLTDQRTTTPFDYARCAIVGPSNGLCCVAHRTTEWHCGGKPAGDGWHQVSGDCYHRETGTSCSE